MKEKALHNASFVQVFFCFLLFSGFAKKKKAIIDDLSYGNFVTPRIFHQYFSNQGNILTAVNQDTTSDMLTDWLKKQKI